MAFGGLKTAPDFANDNVSGIAGKFDENGMCTDNLVKTIKIYVGPGIASGAENEVAEPFTHPILVLRAWVDVLVKEDTGGVKTIGFGTKNTTDGGDVDGFIAAASIAAVGQVLGAGALIGTIVPKDDHLVIGNAANAMTEFEGNFYLQYIDLE